jgi:hypothetical protein
LGGACTSEEYEQARQYDFQEIQRMFARSVGLLLLVLAAALPSPAAEGPIRILFLGDNGHHRPAERFQQLQPVMLERGIELTYTDRPDDLNAPALAKYDGLLIYANIDQITPDQEKALLDYVASGRGFIPLHCASYCFRNSDKYVELVGAQFRRHETGVFRSIVTAPDHPLVRGYGGFESWDETYVHTRHNDQDRVVLEVREEAGQREPWTWVRTHGRGRVFYTAWGHDERTWGNPGFHNLLERGIRWAVGQDPAAAPPFVDRPQMTPRRSDVQPFEYVEAKIPYYPPSRVWGVVGEPITKMQKPLPAEESLKHFVTPVGFQVQLFAAEPDIGKPICMTWDERGRLWIAETIDYPNEKQPQGQGRDRIRICEDTNHDGRADKFTIFADQLSIPTSLLCTAGGVVVHQAPQTLFLRDTNGDDVADERHVLFSGWSLSDTHAGPSNLHFGPDNWIYGIVGYAGFEGQIAGQRQSFRTGFYRFLLDCHAPRGKPAGDSAAGESPNEEPPQGGGSAPRVIAFEFLRNTSNNSWGVGFSEEGLLFGSTANGNPSVYLPIPNRYYERVRGWSSSVLGTIAQNNRFYPITEHVRQVDFHGGFTAAAGHALYTARTYPREYWNRTAFVTEPTGHLAATLVIQPSGADFRSRNAWNLLASDDEWTAPIMAEVGPDGQVWVIDWYNFIVQHNPTPAGFRTGRGAAYETELRDKKHGRIYRVVHTAAPKSQPFSLAHATPQKLVEALGSDNLLWRRHAQRLLVERGQRDVLPLLIAACQDTRVDELGLAPAAQHALWTMHGLGALDGSHAEALAAAKGALKHPSAAVRRAAVLVPPRNDDALSAVLESGAVRDSHPQVRLAALLTLADMPPSAAAAQAVAAALDNPSNLTDRWIMDAATSAAAVHDVHFLKALAETRSNPSPDATRPAPVLELTERVAEHFARGPAEELSALLVSLPQAEPPVAGAIVAGLSRGWRRSEGANLDEASQQALAALFPRLSTSHRGQLVALASRLGSRVLSERAAEISASFLTLVRNEQETDAARRAAAAQLVEFRAADPTIAAELLEIISPRMSPALAQGLVEALAGSTAAETGPALIEALASLTPSTRPAALRVLLGRSDWTLALLEAMEQGRVDLADLSLDQKQALATHPSRRIAQQARRLLARGGGLPNPDRQKVADELLPLTQRTADAAAGKEVFKKHCAKCHTHSGEGTRVGPDLTGMAVHPKTELLVQIIDPSRSVEGNFRSYTVTTTDGRVFNGLLASESRTAIELYDTEGKKQAVLREDIDQLVASSKSLMPDGFEKQLSSDDLANLLEFLTQRGKFLPLPLDKAATVVSTRGMFYDEASTTERLVFEEWSTRTFAGVPFVLVDPLGDRKPNVILLHGPQGNIPPKMPKSVSVPCHAPAKAIHLLGGVSGWGFPLGERGSVSMIVRLHYAAGQTEDHELKNGEHLADYIRRVDVPLSQFAFGLRGRQVRYLAVQPRRAEPIERIEFIKGSDATAPLVVAVTVEAPD